MNSKIIFTILIIMPSIVGAQTGWITRNLTNTSIELFEHKDSFTALYPIVNGYVYVGDDTLNLNDSIKNFEFYPTEYPKYLSEYLITTGKEPKVYTTIEFCFDRVYSINIYTTSTNLISNLKIELERNFEVNRHRAYRYRHTSDSIVRYGDRIVTYGERCSMLIADGSRHKVEYHYVEDLEKGFALLALTSTKVSRRFPKYKLFSKYCSINDSEQVWERLKKCILKNAR